LIQLPTFFEQPPSTQRNCGAPRKVTKGTKKRPPFLLKSKYRRISSPGNAEFAVENGDYPGHSGRPLCDSLARVHCINDFPEQIRGNMKGEESKGILFKILNTSLRDFLPVRIERTIMPSVPCTLRPSDSPASLAAASSHKHISQAFCSASIRASVSPLCKSIVSASVSVEKGILA
jgi:hypothetical protein